MRQARLAVYSVFFCFGLLLSAWVSRVAMMQDRLHLGSFLLGLVLLSRWVASITASRQASWVIHRWGSATVCRISTVVSIVVLPLAMCVTTVSQLVALLTLLGAAGAVWNVAMNTQAAVVQNRYGRSIMSSFHAVCSLGGMVGAAATAVSMRHAVSPVLHMLGMDVVVLVMVGGALGHFLADDERSGGPALTAQARGPVRLLGTLAFCDLLGEGAMADWGAVYLSKVVLMEAASVSIGYAVFSLAMATGRFLGDALVNQFGSITLLKRGSVLAAAGLSLALLWPAPVPVLVGYTLMGCGLSNIVPTLLSSASRISTGAIGPVMAMGSMAFLAGPIMIGGLAEMLPLAQSLYVVVFCVGAISVGARRLSVMAIAGQVVET